LVLDVYRLSKAFPKDELFALISQIRRAVVSLTSNIAEGFGRNSEKEKLHFYSFAYGSLLEVQNQLLIAKDLGYIKPEEYEVLIVLAIEIGKMLQGLIRAIKKFPNC
jgi:four helix bundle protein